MPRVSSPNNFNLPIDTGRKKQQQTGRKSETVQKLEKQLEHVVSSRGDPLNQIFPQVELDVATLRNRIDHRTPRVSRRSAHRLEITAKFRLDFSERVRLSKNRGLFT